jgi:hypothetical protein
MTFSSQYAKGAYLRGEWWALVGLLERDVAHRFAGASL